MDIYHPDPGSCPQVAPSVETPVKSDNLALINTVESMKNIPLDESAPTAQSSEGLAPLRLIPLHVPGFADSIDRNTNRGPLDEDIKMSDLEQTQSSQGSAFPFAEDPSVNTKGLGPVYDQDIAMADHHTEVQFGSSSLQSTDHKEAEYLPKPQGTKPTDDLLIPDVQGVQTLSAKSLPSGIGAAHRTDPIGGASAELIVSYQQDRNLALQSLAYLPPQPYGCSPYPSITTTSPPMKPLPLSPSISYASTADLNERDGIDLGPPSLVAVPLVTGTNGAEGSTASIEPSLSAQSHGTGTTRSSDDHLASDWTIDRSKTTDQSLLIPQQNINPASLSQTLAQTLALSSFEKQNGITEHRYDPNHLDLLPRIKGLYRLLDLYSETTGSGLVDKIIISQASLGQFINAVLPGAYTSVTKIDFHRLDREARLPLIGIYGSKTEIIRFLLAAGSIDDDAAGLLQLPEDISIRTRPVLRSGIYMLDPPNSDRDSSNPPTRYVIYWPENTTWEAQSSGSVRKNRVTFMRYLTCLTDQIRCLVSPEHGEKLVFEDEDDDADGSGDDGFDLGWGERDDGVNDRFFKFEVAKTSEQEENSRVEGGFKIEDRSLLARVKVPLPNGRSLNLEPHLLAGETVQAFSSLKYNEGFDKEVIIDGAFNHHRFKYTLKGYGSILIPETMEQNDLDLLLDKGDLEHRLPPGLTKDYRKKMSEIQTRYEEEERKTLKQALQSAKDSHSRLKSETRLFLINRLFDTYPCLDWKALFPGEIQPTTATDKDPLEYLNFVLFTSSIVQEALDVSMKDARLDSISYKAYAQVKKPFMIVRNVLDKHPDLTDEQRAVLVKAIAQEDPTAKTTESTATGWKKFNPFHWGRALLPKIGITNDEETDSLIKVYSRVEDEPDPAFLSSLSNLVNRHPLLSEDASQLLDSAVEGLRQKLQRLTDSVVAKLSLAYERQLKHQCELVARTGKQKEQLEAFSEYRCQVRTSLAGTNAQSSLTISWIKPRKGWSSDIEMKASTRQHLEPNIAVGIWVLDLGEDDTQRIRDDPTFIPVPRIPQRVQFEKQLPLNWVIRRVQMLGPKKCLLVIDGPEKTRIWIFSPHAGFNIDAPTYHLPLVPNRKYVVAVDEQKRVLAFIMMGTNTCVLQQYLIDLESSAIHGRGSPFNLLPWYDGVTPEISHAAFFSGSNDLCLVESSGRIRVLSIAQQNFRPATILLQSGPLFVRSSPDGSALLVLEGVKNGPRTLRVFHHASFGSNAGGILNTLPESFSGVDAFSITSIAERGNVFILGLDSSRTTIVSARVEISRKEIEYQFRAKQEGPRQHSGKVSASNTLVTCFSEVWERFPVAAAIQRETISREDRQPSSLTFVCDAHKPYFTSYFLKMITAFEESSKKPTGHRLASIQLSSSSFDDLVWETPSSSNFKAGEWVVELLCLIPIHIAVTDENRLIPLKDGVRDPALERELLGADVSSIIDSISLGWYESILSVYMASKEVKVISSMGEQSVGKSYSLNHMVDSSFAGSAVRTTEGVWLSVCPTRDCVVVALDFEGVHSIERTPQEDMLLVLFNTALSNLIIFRNNFALSRDVANMFTSFQASTHLFDPKSNPKLFKGLLAIVIKDVVDADKKDIVKEFSSKFSQIVSKEQASNFITVLHNSQLTVIPWSVILSSDFYRLFFKLGKTLFNQKTTHDSAGEFLITLKTLMAKMKAQDWGSLDHTVIKHRVATLSKLLPSVLVLGRSGSDTDGEELKNMDNQVPIPSNDTPAKFYLGKIGNERAEALDRLVKEWNIDASRRPTSDLVQHLNDIAGRRIASAEEWIKQNVSRFPQDNGDMRALKRRFDDLVENLLANIQLCLAECSECRLRCMLNRSHATQNHDCQTSHRCIDPCDYTDDHDTEEPCGLPAGHGGRHICDPSSHLCGRPCLLNSRRGCQGHCTKPVGDDHTKHMCSARVHLCGKACDLHDVSLHNGRQFSCNLTCTRPYDEDHTRHVCDNRLACPIECELCPRLCSAADHLHGLESDAVHLCGQSHPCHHQCGAAGICEVNTTPHSVETTFSGRHSTFSYTKYTQVAKRLDCAIVVPPGARQHSGPHIHSTDPKPFHYCETRCLNCGYFCTLGRGHQSEHNTAHGSMELTAWAVEGDASAVIEVQGRKFAAQETGAPQLCSSICRNLGRHAHIDYCRNLKGECRDPESEHITTRMLPNLDRPKDWITHREFWARTGFRDPYSIDEQDEFKRCNVQCAGSEHDATVNPQARPSYCELDIFHPPQLPSWNGNGNNSYISADGHSFGCPNPNNLRQAFHIIFVLDRSGSMGSGDRRPLEGQPVSATISRHNNNRFGAVLSALYGFWTSRGSGNQTGRLDAYSVITFDSSPEVQFTNDLNRNPDQLLNAIVQVRPRGDTNFNAALAAARTTMESHWSTERSPVVIFLSDGQCTVSDNVIHDLCNRAVARGKPLSFHSVSFGPAASSASLRRMVTIAEQVAANAPPNPLNPLVPCGYTNVMDTIRLAETFLNIAESLQKPRAALLRS